MSIASATAAAAAAVAVPVAVAVGAAVASQEQLERDEDGGSDESQTDTCFICCWKSSEAKRPKMRTTSSVRVSVILKFSFPLL